MQNLDQAEVIPDRGRGLQAEQDGGAPTGCGGADIGGRQGAGYQVRVTFKMPVPLGQILDQFGKGFVIGHSDLHRVHTTGPHLFKDARRPVGILQPVDQMSHADKLSSGSAAPKPENDIIRAIDRQTLGDG